MIVERLKDYFKSENIKRLVRTRSHGVVGADMKRIQATLH